tara:strand:+ start:8115 stop:8420 length:306 start_codon:yes stop_codon:yes gene_type:complete
MWFYSKIDTLEVTNIEYIDLTNSEVIYGDLKIKFLGNAKPIEPFDLYEIFNKSDGNISIHKSYFNKSHIIYIDAEHKILCEPSSTIEFYINGDLIKTLKVE